MMRQGGNSQIRRFFSKLEIGKEPIQSLYCSKAAVHYREKLKERVSKIMNGEISSVKRNIPKLPSSDVDDRIHEKQPSKKAFVYSVLFGEGPMGMTLTKDHKERAAVSKLVEKGPAQANGIKVGDFVVGVGGRMASTYSEIMILITGFNRPIELKFSRVAGRSLSLKGWSNGSEPQLSSLQNEYSENSSISEKNEDSYVVGNGSPKNCKAKLRGISFSSSHSDEELDTIRNFRIKNRKDSIEVDMPSSLPKNQLNSQRKPVDDSIKFTRRKDSGLKEKEVIPILQSQSEKVTEADELLKPSFLIEVCLKMSFCHLFVSMLTSLIDKYI